MRIEKRKSGSGGLYIRGIGRSRVSDAHAESALISTGLLLSLMAVLLVLTTNTVTSDSRAMC